MRAPAGSAGRRAPAAGLIPAAARLPSRPPLRQAGGCLLPDLGGVTRPRPRTGRRPMSPRVHPETDSVCVLLPSVADSTPPHGTAGWPAARRHRLRPGPGPSGRHRGTDVHSSTDLKKELSCRIHPGGASAPACSPSPP
ncbi:hypothetical protein GCM10011594_32940 [Nakamurella endophytica]|uniref:Uncharacterized protein n=1 Tax=Nakamurella endophytica TaxID=1748367 RepID=A0A917T4D2_9ACTN|nr:hypothetical protein GCM10011594_32940 [Nakamurella endophytica]